MLTIVRNKAVLGIKENKDGKQWKDWPAIITQSEWDLAHEAMKLRDAGNVNVPGTKHRNLFEGACFCARCARRVGVTQSSYAKRLRPRMRCHGKYQETGCTSKGKSKYDENESLKQFQNFHWESFFSDTKEEEDLAHKRKLLIKAEEKVRKAQLQMQNIMEAMKKAAREGRDIPFLVQDLPNLEIERKLAQIEATNYQNQILKDSNRKTGKEAAQVIQSRINKFLSSNREDPVNREEFNLWMRSEGLVLHIDFDQEGSQKVEIVLGKVKKNRLVEFNRSVEDLHRFNQEGASVDLNHFNNQRKHQVFKPVPEGHQRTIVAGLDNNEQSYFWHITADKRSPKRQKKAA